MNERGVEGGGQPDIARRVQELEEYCHGDSDDVLSLEGLQERVRGIPPEAVLGSEFFHHACANKGVTLEIVECLLGAFPGAAQSVDEYGESPLHCCCGNETIDLRIVQLLMNRWPESVNRQNDSGMLPLHTLCEICREDETAPLAILDLLLDAAPLSATAVDITDALPIHGAVIISGKSYSFCKRLIDAHPESLRVRDGDGKLPIHIACDEGLFDTVQYLMEWDPESIEARSVHGALPIHYAVAARRTSRGGSGSTARVCLDSVRLLFDAYPEAITIQDSWGRTPLDIAAVELREFLEEQLAYARLAEDITAMATPDDENGWLPLHHALRNNAPLGAIKLLIAGNQDALQVPDDQSVFPLHIACEYSSVGVVQHLLALSDIHLHTLDLQKNSTLHYACRGGNTGVVKYLLERGVLPSVSEPNCDGKLPIHLMWESDRVDRNSVEYVDAVRRLLLAHPETVAL